LYCCQQVCLCATVFWSAHAHVNVWVRVCTRFSSSCVCIVAIRLICVLVLVSYPCMCTWLCLLPFVQDIQRPQTMSSEGVWMRCWCFLMRRMNVSVFAPHWFAPTMQAWDILSWYKYLSCVPIYKHTNTCMHTYIHAGN
jgi:hypothetical protein